MASEIWPPCASAMRASAGEVDRACIEDPPRPLSADAGERLKRTERHAAAMQAMFGAMANACVAIAPNLTTAQREILSRNIVQVRHSGRVFWTEKVLIPETWPGPAVSSGPAAQRSLRELRHSDPPQSPSRFVRLREPASRHSFWETISGAEPRAGAVRNERVHRRRWSESPETLNVKVSTI